jgi:Cu2+-exporting ATPase
MTEENPGQSGAGKQPSGHAGDPAQIDTGGVAMPEHPGQGAASGGPSPGEHAQPPMNAAPGEAAPGEHAQHGLPAAPDDAAVGPESESESESGPPRGAAMSDDAGDAAAPGRIAPGEHAQPEMPAAPGNASPGERAHPGMPAAPGEHAGHSVAMFRRKFWVSLLLTVPTLIWGPMLRGVLPYAPPSFPGSAWIPAVFGAAVFLYGGLVFLRGAVAELEDGRPGMMTLIALAITVAFAFSAVVTLGLPGMALWEELATLVTIMLFGHWLEMRSIVQASGALRELARLLPRTAALIRPDGAGTTIEEVPLEALRPGDVVLVRPGAAIPADGVVREGSSDVNEAALTGESRPVEKSPGDAVIAGTVNGAGSLRAEVRGVGEATALARIVRLVAQAQASRSRAQALADRAAFALTIVAVAAALLTLAGWLLAGAPGDFVIERVVTVLVIACPHALGLAIPLVIAISTTVGARHGLLVRDRRGLEEARRLDLVVFDKTGTLTRGEPRVVNGATVPGGRLEDALRLIAAVEADSEHPLARAIVASARERGLELPRAIDFQALPGRGVRADVNGRELEVGGPNLLRELHVTPPPGLARAAATFAARGWTVVYLVEHIYVLAVLAVADEVRPESGEAVRRLHEEGIRCAMLTGDARPVAETVAQQLAIDTVYAEVLPGQKADRIRELQLGPERGGARQRVAMVGDGVNDAPALVTADVGIAIGAGTAVAVEAGDIVLVRSDPRDVAGVVRLSRATYRKMLQNLWWAAGYNIVAIPLAAGVLAPWGIVLHPAVGAVLMSASTIIVALNAQLLRRVKL